MKVTLIVFLNIFLLVSNCSEDKKVTDTQEKTENWELTLFRSGSRAGNEEQSLPYKENYTFNIDSTFIKSRQDRVEYVEGWGTYIKNKTEEGTYYNLTFDHTAYISESCTGKESETLLLREDGKLQNTTMMCDRPFKEYSKLQIKKGD